MHEKITVRKGPSAPVRSAYCWNGLSIRKTDMQSPGITHIGINQIWESSGSHQHSFLVRCLLTVALSLCVIW